jgi:hypothetical protein
MDAIDLMAVTRPIPTAFISSEIGVLTKARSMYLKIGK